MIPLLLPLAITLTFPAAATPIELSIAIPYTETIESADTLQQYDTPYGCRWIHVYITGSAGYVQWYDTTGNGIGNSQDATAVDGSARLPVNASAWFEHRIPGTGYGSELRYDKRDRDTIPIFVAVEASADVVVQCARDGD